LTTTVYRIGTHKARTLPDLGYGSTLQSGRWHLTPPDGLPVVYAGGSRAICQLEKRVHCNGVTPINLIMLALQMPVGAPLQTLEDLGIVLPPDWIDQQALTQDVGVAWRKSGSGLGLWVPSAVEPDEFNLVLNPSHRAYGSIGLTILRDPFAFDPRMFD
jgi:RES domain-containing protein